MASVRTIPVVFRKNSTVAILLIHPKSLQLRKPDTVRRHRKFHLIEAKSVTLCEHFSKVCKGFRKSDRPDGAEKFQLQPAHSVSCNWNFSASSDRSDFRKPLHTFDNAVTLFAPISGISRIPTLQTAEHSIVPL